MDSPGLFDTTLSNADVALEIIGAVGAMAPGPHAFLYVVSPGRYTNEEHATYEKLKKVFDKVNAHMVVVFTHLDQLREDGTSTDVFLNNLNEKLQTVLEECKWRHVFFDNRSPTTNQVGRLLYTVKKLGGSTYISQYSSIVKDILTDMIKGLDRGTEERGIDEIRKNRRDGESFEFRQELSTGLLYRFIDFASKHYRQILEFVKWLFK